MALARCCAVIVCLLLSSLAAMPLAITGDDGTAGRGGGDEPLLDAPTKPTGFGPYLKGYIDVNITRALTGPVKARIYYPALADGENTTTNSTGAPWPTVVFIPGGNGTLSYCNAISSRIASWGFVVVNVELGNMFGQPGYRSVITMAQETSDVIDYVENQTVNASHPLFGMMDPDKMGVSGHSWGGITSGYSVTDQYGDTRFLASVPISAQPVLGTGTEYIKQVHVPVGLMSGTAEVYQQDEIFKNGNVPITYIRVVGADHSSILLHHEYVVAFFKYWLCGETGYEHWVYTDGVLADKAAGTVTYDRNLVNLTVNATPASLVEDDIITVKALAGGLIYGTMDFKVVWGDLSDTWGPDTNNTTTHSYNSSSTFDVLVTSEDDYEKDTVSLKVTVRNVAPVPKAGANVTCNEDEAEHFNGTDSTDTPSDRPGLSYKWDFGDGRATDFASDPAAVHAYEKRGTYGVMLTVKDGDGATATDNLTVIVKNVPPSAEAGPNITAAEDEEAMFLSGSGNDTPSDLKKGLAYSWDFGDGYGSARTGSPLSSHVYEKAGNYTATLSVFDDDGAVANDTLRVTVDNLAPTAAITAPEDGALFQKDVPIDLSGTGSDTGSDAATLLYRWDFGDGTNGTEWGTESSATYTFTRGGDHDVIFHVMDDNGAEATSSITITVENAPPVCTIIMPQNRASFKEDGAVTFNATAEDTLSDMGLIVFEWDFGDGTNASGGSVKHAFTSMGDYKIKVTATDPEGAADKAEVAVTVTNVPPKVEATLSSISIKAGEAVTFSGSGSDTPSDSISLASKWDFADGTMVVTEPNGTHVFKAPGTFDVVFTVTDNDDEKASVHFTVTVAANGTGGGGGGDGDGGTGSGLLGGNAMMVVGGLVAAVVAVLAVVLLMRRRRGKGRAE